jgi:flagellin
MRINSVNTQFALRTLNNNLSYTNKSLEKLSSGYRINNSADTVDDLQTPGLGAFNLTFQPYENTQIALQVGSDNGQTMDVGLSQINTNTLNINSLSLGSQSSAEAAISLIDDALNTLNSSRATVGALQNWLEKTLDFVGIQKENQMSSESRIRDVDFASEMTIYTKNQILSQAAQSMVTQANIRQQNILNLLNSVS